MPGAYRLIEVMAHWVCQSPYSVVEDEEILVLIFSKSKYKRIEDKAQVRDQLCARLFLQGRKRAGKSKTDVR